VRSSKLASGLAGGLLIGAALLAGCARHGGQGGPHGPSGPPEVGVVTLRAAPVTLITELPGRTSPFETSDVRPQVGGIIVDRSFTEGGQVRAGQVLYRIDPAPYRAAYDEAKAQVASAGAALVTARNKASRYGDLVKINGVAKQDYDDAQAAYGQAAASLQQLRAAADAARINLGYATITAPISGRIGISTVTKGALVTAGQTNALTTIQRLDPIYVDVTEAASEVLRLRRALQAGRVTGGGPASLTVRLKLEDGSDYPLEGHLQFTDVTVDQTTGAVTLRALFPNPGDLLLPGMYVRAEVAQGVAPAGLLAPQQGVVRDEKGLPTAMVVNAQGRAEFRALQTGPAIGNAWLVTSGLKPGDRLIVEGLQRVKPGAPVRAVAAALPPAQVQTR
jgi:membrane fusion protein (multidrug efflux system)